MLGYLLEEAANEGIDFQLVIKRNLLNFLHQLNLILNLREFSDLVEFLIPKERSEESNLILVLIKQVELIIISLSQTKSVVRHHPQDVEDASLGLIFQWDLEDIVVSIENY
jgi:hypothetical protein